MNSSDKSRNRLGSISSEKRTENKSNYFALDVNLLLLNDVDLLMLKEIGSLIYVVVVIWLDCR